MLASRPIPADAKGPPGASPAAPRAGRGGPPGVHSPYQPKSDFFSRLRMLFSSAQAISRVCAFTAFSVNL